MLRAANPIVVWLCAAAFLPLGCLEAYSRGAPDSQCRYMTPKHGFQPQNVDPRDDIPAWIQVSICHNVLNYCFACFEWFEERIKWILALQ